MRGLPCAEGCQRLGGRKFHRLSFSLLPLKRLLHVLCVLRRRRLTPQPIKVRADVEMTCFSYDGVEKIKEAMRAAQACSTDACPVMMKLVAAPRYVLTTQTLDKTQVGRGLLG
jgi:translation initiation factor 2 alpha subunit (eIF-2alpha)